MLKGAPIPLDGSRDYLPLRGFEATAYNDRLEGPLLALDTKHDVIDVTPEQASELVAVLLQFIADAEVS